MSQRELVAAFESLPPWPADRDLGADEWSLYIAAAREVQRSDPAELESALLESLDGGFEAESSLFLLSRVVFELPDRAPAAERRVWKGWTNWPDAGPAGTLDLSWPVGWDGSRPHLTGYFEGAEGPRYAAVEEFRDLRDRFSLRRLPDDGPE